MTFFLHSVCFCLYVFIYMHTHKQNHLMLWQLYRAVAFFNMGTVHNKQNYENVDIKTAVKIKLFHLYQKGLDFCCAFIFLPKQLLHFLSFLKTERSWCCE